MSACYFQSTVGNIVYERTVMAYEDHSLGKVLQILLKPLDGLNVQMVSRLVEQQHIRLFEKDLCKLDSHSPPPRELFRRSVEVGAFEAKSYESTLHFGFIIASAHHDKTLMLLGEAFYKSVIIIAFIVGALSHFVLHVLESLLQSRRVGKSLACFFTDSGVVGNFHNLRQIAYCRGRRY